MHIYLNINTPLTGATPPIANRDAVMNIRNHDQKCFVWSIVAAICQATGPAHLVTSYVENPETVLNLNGLSFRVKETEVARKKQFAAAEHVFLLLEKKV